MTTTQDAGKATAGTDSAKADASKTFTQEDVDRILGDRLGRLKDQYADFDKYKADAAELAKIRDGQKSDLEKAQTAAEALKSKLTETETSKADLELRLLRLQTAAEKGLTDPKLVKRVGGNKLEEIEADVAELLEIQGAAPSGPKPNPQQGTASSTRATGRAEGIAEADRRFGAITT